MTHRARHEREDLRGSPADAPGRVVVPGKDEFWELVGLTLAAGAFTVVVMRPEVPEALVHALAARTAAFGH